MWHPRDMRRAALVVGLSGLATAARADVDLLRVPGAVVAVSSTVDNPAIIPDHLVDGDLGTAWNSRTGDLKSAWIAFRVPANAHVATIRMTVGFTRKDARGDLFAMNQRVTKVFVSRDGKRLVERALDPDVRAMQDIAIDAPGGDFTIEIAELVPGTKPDWREVAVSELEVRGTIADPGKRTRPPVRVGALDVDCAKALFPSVRANRIAAGDVVSATAFVRLGADFGACRVDHGATVSIAAVTLGDRPAIAGARLDRTTSKTDDQHGGGHYDKIELEEFALTDRETALLVHSTSADFGPMFEDVKKKTTLYRVSRAGLVPVLEFESSSHSGESGDRSDCAVQRGDDRAPLPDLDVACTHHHDRYPGDPNDRDHESTDTAHYRWNGTKYAAR